MKLSEAILLGSTITTPMPDHMFTTDHGEVIGACALGMGELAIGKISDVPVDAALIWLIEDMEYAKAWPWLVAPTRADCPAACSFSACSFFVGLRYADIVAHLFDHHVFARGSSRTKWTLEQLVDWVRSVEPAEPETDTPTTMDALLGQAGPCEVLCAKEETH